MSAQPVPRMTYAEYLAREKTSEEKHEYLRGEVWAMAGGTRKHARLASNLMVALGSRLRGKPCGVFGSDLRVRIEETDRTTYPDVTVVCGKFQGAHDDPNAVTNPVLIVEVLSESTEASDRGEKFAHFRHLASLREYVLVNQLVQRIEVFRRGPGTSWTLTYFEAGEVHFESIDVTISVADVYADPTA